MFRVGGRWGEGVGVGGFVGLCLYLCTGWSGGRGYNLGVGV
jgi:hypothetical protein